MAEFSNEMVAEAWDQAVEGLIDSVQRPPSIVLDMEAPLCAYILHLICSNGIPHWQAPKGLLKADDVRAFCLFLYGALPPELRTEVPAKRSRRKGPKP